MRISDTISTLWFNPRKGIYTSAVSCGNYDRFTGFIPPEEDIDPDYVLILKNI